MTHMFYGCSSLKELNLSNFNTNNVSDMICMFEGCSSLKELNISNFNFKNVKNFRSMFENCSSLENLDISIFKNLTIDWCNPLDYMFKGCSSLKDTKKLKKKIEKQKNCICF